MYGGWGSVGPGSDGLAQTYEVGISGNFVAAEIYVRTDGEPATVTMQLKRLQGFRPSINGADVSSIATATLPRQPSPPYQSLFSWVRLSFPPAPVHAGETLAFIFGSDKNHNPTWYGARTNGSTSAWVRGPDYEPWGHPMSNFAFRTYVIPIPEPTSGSLLGLLVAVVVVRRRR
jgi:hypothetical protein